MSDQPKITPSMLLNAYASGYFPMAESADSDEIMWIDPDLRGVIPLNGLHISTSLKKLLKSDRYVVQVNQRFADVLTACADRSETWINRQIFDLYCELHELRFAHSVEIYENGALVGGLYGVAIDGAFFGESMFSKAPSASKIALVGLVTRLRLGGYTLLDTQFITPHLQSMGGIEIEQSDYKQRLKNALGLETDFFRLQFSDTASIWQLSTQMS